jgi:hypothetical protein
MQLRASGRDAEQQGAPHDLIAAIIDTTIQEIIAAIGEADR